MQAQSVACISFGITLRISASQRLRVKKDNSQTHSQRCCAGVHRSLRGGLAALAQSFQLGNSSAPC